MCGTTDDPDRTASSPFARADASAVLEMFRFSLDQAPDAVFWVNADAGFFYVNEQACRSLGYEREELLRLRLWDVDPEVTPEVWKELWSLYLGPTGLTTRKSESRHRRKDGTTFPVEVSARHVQFGDTHFHVAFQRDVSARKQVERDLLLTQTAIDRASVGCYWIGSDGRFLYVNEWARRSLGYSREELLSRYVWDVDPLSSEALWRGFWEELPRKEVAHFETVHQRKDGTRFPVGITTKYFEFDGQGYSCAFGRDLTDRNEAREAKARLELELARYRKLESIGRLAGGIAHDFNNMLTVILGYVDIMKSQLPPSDRLLRAVVGIEGAAERSRDITRQLVAFSRTALLTPEPVDLNRAVDQARSTLAFAVGEGVEIAFRPGSGLWTVKVDAGQLDELLENLAVNARDAMPDGGVLRIETRNVELRPEDCADDGESAPGEYVVLTVGDTGHGIGPDFLANLFEPFFTTKDIGKGRGLGLATVYGIVRQHGGFIQVESEVARGTTFRVHLPRFAGQPEEASPAETFSGAAGSGTVLLVEDERLVRDMTELMLRRLGYRVLGSGLPSEALVLLENAEGPVDLLLTDVVLPGMSGLQLAERARERWPDLRVLFTSAHGAKIVMTRGAPAEGVHFLPKPFGVDELARKLREVLATAPAG